MEDFNTLDKIIIAHITDMVAILKKIDPDGLYKAEKLLPDLWKDFEGYHTTIGKRIKALSKNKTLPIVPVKRTSCNKQLYRLL